MATTQTTTLTFRIEPGLKEALRAAAELEHRSIANVNEMMIREYCGKVRVEIAEPTPSKKVQPQLAQAGSHLWTDKTTIFWEIIHGDHTCSSAKRQRLQTHPIQTGADCCAGSRNKL